MSDDFQIRKDIDNLKNFKDDLERLSREKYGVDDVSTLLSMFYDASVVDTLFNNVYNRVGLDKPSSDKFNFATVNKTENNITYEEYWIMANAYYDYDNKRFVKINPNNTSFGIQIQGTGNYPGEAELGYFGNNGINIWRNPTKDSFESAFPNWESDVYYDFSDFMGDNSYIGAKLRSDDSWHEFGIMCGWTNSFMIDSFGGMTIGGAGFEIDGNGIFPYTRLTHSKYTVSNTTYYLLGLLDNAYHNLSGCDDNSTYSWFVGLRIPEASSNIKDNVNASFVVMYNDTTYNSSNIHELDNTKWHVVFQVNKNGVI